MSESHAAEPAPTPDPAEAEEGSFSSSHTQNFPALLQRLGISLLVSTYQAGKLIIVRPEGDVINTHFCAFASPMGIAYHPLLERLAIGTREEVWQFRNLPEIAAKLPPAGSHDAVFLPRTRHCSGDIRIHEIGWVEEQLWAVNTRFSCLCTFDEQHSFVPRWRPKFITALAPEDRCHLNGFAIVEGRPKYVTCLGLTDTVGGWRVNKASGGCLLDVETDEVLVQGLCMPHSPRVYGGKHWLLESGHGTLSRLDLAAGKAEEVTRLPGFTRGMDIHSGIAFIGLSQVRETAIFSGIPLMEEVPERACGVWAVELKTGRTLAFLRFEGAVQEIFAVQVLPGIRFPDVIRDPHPLLGSSFVLPDEAYLAVPEALRGSG